MFNFKCSTSIAKRPSKFFQPSAQSNPLVIGSIFRSDQEFIYLSKTFVKKKKITTPLHSILDIYFLGSSIQVFLSPYTGTRIPRWRLTFFLFSNTFFGLPNLKLSINVVCFFICLLLLAATSTLTRSLFFLCTVVLLNLVFFFFFLYSAIYLSFYNVLSQVIYIILNLLFALNSTIAFRCDSKV